MTLCHYVFRSNSAAPASIEKLLPFVLPPEKDWVKTDAFWKKYLYLDFANANSIHSHLEPLALLRDLLLKSVIWTHLEQLEQSIGMPKTFFELMSSAHFAKSVVKPKIQTNRAKTTNFLAAKRKKQNPKPNLRPNQFELPCWRNVPTLPFVSQKYPNKCSNSSTQFTPSSSVAGWCVQPQAASSQPANSHKIKKLRNNTIEHTQFRLSGSPGWTYIGQQTSWCHDCCIFFMDLYKNSSVWDLHPQICKCFFLQDTVSADYWRELLPSSCCIDWPIFSMWQQRQGLQRTWKTKCLKSFTKTQSRNCSKNTSAQVKS